MLDESIYAKQFRLSTRGGRGKAAREITDSRPSIWRVMRPQFVAKIFIRSGRRRALLLISLFLPRLEPRKNVNKALILTFLIKISRLAEPF